MEADIQIGAETLSDAESMTVRVAMEAFIGFLSSEGLGSDEHGRAMTEAYLKNAHEIRRLIQTYIGRPTSR